MPTALKRKKYKVKKLQGGGTPTTPEEILAYAQEKRKLEAELLEKYGSVRKIPEGIMRNKKVFAFSDLPPLPRKFKPSDAELQYAMDYYGVSESKARYSLAYPQFAPGGDQDPDTWAFRVESGEPFVRTVATTLSLAPVLGEVLDIINVPWAAATGTDMYTGNPMSTTEAGAWAAGGILIPNVFQKSTQWLIKQGAKNADDIKRIIRPHLNNIDDAPADLKPLLQLQKKSSELKAHLRQYDTPQGKDMGGGFKSSYDPGKTTSEAAGNFLTQNNPELVLQFSPSSFNKGMFDADLSKWGDAYLTSYRGVGARNIDEAATFMRNPYGGGLMQYGKGTYSTSHLPTATGYGGYVGAIRDMPNIGRSGQFGGDIVKDISNLEAVGGSTKRIFGDNPQILRPGSGIYTSGDVVRVSRPETTIKSGILDVVPSLQADNLLRYRSDFGGVGPYGTGGYNMPNTKRGMDAVMDNILNISTKKKGGKIKLLKGGKVKVLKNGGTPEGDPIPTDSLGVTTPQIDPVLTDSLGTGYIRNEAGNLVPIGWSEFHEESDIDMDDLMRGIAAVESGGGQDIFMKNPVTSATGTYQQLFDEIKDMDIMKGITRDDFAKDKELQNKIFNMRYMGEIPDVPGLEDNAYELTEMFKDDLGEKWNFSLDEVAALSNFIGRQGTINYFKALKAGETYTPPGTNKTVDQYLKEYREARDNYSKGGKFKVKKRRKLKVLKN